MVDGGSPASVAPSLARWDRQHRGQFPSAAANRLSSWSLASTRPALATPSAHEMGVVLGQPRRVQTVDRDPLSIPGTTASAAPDPPRTGEIAAYATSTTQNHHTRKSRASRPKAVADQNRTGCGIAEQPGRVPRLRYARGRCGNSRVLADRSPQPGAERPRSRDWMRQAVSSPPQRRLVPGVPGSLGERLEQRHKADHAVAQRAGRNRQALHGKPRGDPLQRAQAGIALDKNRAHTLVRVPMLTNRRETGGADTSRGDDVQVQVRCQRDGEAHACGL